MMFESVLFYTNKVKILRRFYKNVLGLPITQTSDDAFTIKIGTSDVTFKYSDTACFYHFAINIPGNQFSIIKYWLKDRLTLVRKNGEDQFYSSSFNADYMFLDDPAGNRVKLIGRRDRDLFGDLTAEAFLNISEVKIITEFVEEVGDQLQDFGLPLFHGAVIDLEGINYLGRGDTYVALEAPVGKKLFSNQQATETHPLEITLYGLGKIILNETGQVSLTPLIT